MDTSPEQTSEPAQTAPIDPQTPLIIPVGADLTEQQRAFCIQMAKGATHTDAYERSYPNCKNRRTAENSGRKLARLPKIAEFVSALKSQTLDYTGIADDRIKQEIGRIAFSDIRQLFGPDGEILPIEQWPTGAAAAVSGYKEEVLAGGTRIKREVKLWDKPGMLKLLADIKALTNAKPDATQRATFTFNFGAPGAGKRGKAGGRTIEGTLVPPRKALT
jgi:phage terminase small subunit